MLPSNHILVLNTQNKKNKYMYVHYAIKSLQSISTYPWKKTFQFMKPLTVQETTWKRKSKNVELRNARLNCMHRMNVHAKDAGENSV